MLSPSERRLRAQIAAHEMHARHDARATTAAGRAASARKLDEQLLAKIDPRQELPPEERARRLDHARRAHFARLALRSAKKRRSGKAAERAVRSLDLSAAGRGDV